MPLSPSPRGAAGAPPTSSSSSRVLTPAASAAAASGEWTASTAPSSSASAGAVSRSVGGGGAELIVGQRISAEERIRWVRLLRAQPPPPSRPHPSSSGREDVEATESEARRRGDLWFPALVYESYGELFGDVHQSQKRLRAKVLLEKIREDRGQVRPRPVAFLIGFHPLTILPLRGHSIAESEADGERVLDFYEHYEEVFHSTLRALEGRVGSDGRSMFERAVEIAMRHLERNVGDGGDVVRIMGSDSEDGPAAVATLLGEEDASAGGSARQLEPLWQAESAHAVTVRAAENEGRSPDRAEALASAAAAPRRYDAKLRPEDELPPVPDLDPHDDWKSAWKAMRRAGWNWKEGSGLMQDYYYIKPGRNIKRGQEGIDYFTSEEAVRAFAARHYGWVDPAKVIKRRVRPKDGSDEDAARADRRRARLVSFSPKTAAEQAKLMAEGAAMETPPDDAPPSSGARKTRSRAALGTLESESEPVTSTPVSSESAVPEILGTPILSTDSWLAVWDKLKYSGWQWKSGGGLYDYYYILPGKSIKTGVKGVDYFTTEDEVRKYVKSHYGWTDNDGDGHGDHNRKESKTSWDGGAKNKAAKRNKKEPKTSRSLRAEAKVEAPATKTTPSASKRTKQSEGGNDSGGDVPLIMGTPIGRSDPWSLVWEKLKHSGWTWKGGTGLMTDYYYVKPGGSTKTGVKGIDFFTSEKDVREFVAKNYDWADLDRGGMGAKKRKRGGDDARAEDTRNGRRKRRREDVPTVPSSIMVKSSSGQPAVRRKIIATSGDSEDLKALKKKAAASSSAGSRHGRATAKDEKGDTKTKAKARRSGRDDKTKKVAVSGKKPNISKKSSRKKPPLAPATRKPSPPDRIWGSAPKTTRKCRKSTSLTPGGSAHRTPAGQSTKPQDPGAPLLSSPSSYSSGSSSSSGSSEDSETYYAWSNLWPRLKQYGWRVIPAGGINPLHDWYWVRPNKNVKDPSTKLGVDYFSTVTGVIDYQRRMDLEEKEKERGGGRGRRTGREASPEGSKSAVMDEFDREAIVAASSTSSPASAAAKRWRSLRSPMTSSAQKPGRDGGCRGSTAPWWKSSPFLSFRAIWAVLHKKLKFHYTTSGLYVLPDGRNQKEGGRLGIDYFESTDQMRRALCRHGIPNLHSAEASLDQEDRDAVVRWASTALVEGINEHNTPSALEHVPVLSSDDAWMILRNRLDYCKVNEVYYAPGKQNRGSHAGMARGRDYFHDVEELRSHIRIHGLGGNDDDGGRAGRSERDGSRRVADLSNEDRLALALWASLSPLPTYAGSEEGTSSSSSSVASRSARKSPLRSEARTGISLPGENNLSASESEGGMAEKPRLHTPSDAESSKKGATVDAVVSTAFQKDVKVQSEQQDHVAPPPQVGDDMDAETVSQEDVTQ